METSLNNINFIICNYFRVPLDYLQQKTNLRHIVEKRQLAQYYARKLNPGISYAEIGKFWASRDHCTVLHSIKVIENLKTTDKQFAKYVDDLDQIFSNKHYIRKAKSKLYTGLLREFVNTFGIEKAVILFDIFQKYRKLMNAL